MDLSSVGHSSCLWRVFWSAVAACICPSCICHSFCQPSEWPQHTKTPRLMVSLQKTEVMFSCPYTTCWGPGKTLEGLEVPRLQIIIVQGLLTDPDTPPTLLLHEMLTRSYDTGVLGSVQIQMCNGKLVKLLMEDQNFMFLLKTGRIKSHI